MSESNEEIRYILKFYYKKGQNATQAAKFFCDVYGPSAVSVRVAQIWFKHFQSGNFDVKDPSRCGRPMTDKMDAIFEKVEQDRHISSYDVAEERGIDHKTVLAHLKKTGYTKKLNTWVPHHLTVRNLMNCVLIFDSLLRLNETEPFLKKLITGDEKWITYDKNVRKRSWSNTGQASQTVAKPGITRNKVMLCVWCDWKGIIQYELLPPGRTIDSELYC
ncbi:histone-lysine N-methyltransferase SETMAR-like [Pieris napi]|uniref:histone-lysine N-methyltransferase SETMAR-like n=1 Tax=Pieris napi TaxID=78633 RepID=UPI001FB93E46|nr:histone-lysine N-methyltransferase SETMAR-like [Pieris napi]